MTLSRTARILIAVLLLAAAAFFWVNFFSQEQPAATPVTATRTPVRTPSATKAPATASAPSAAKPNAAATTATSNPASKEAAPVVVANKPAVATHDLQVAELPFLVTQPPAPSATATSGGSSGSGGATANPSSNQRAASAQRMTVNPFSPIVVQAAAHAAPPPQATIKPPASQTVASAPAPASAPPKLAEAPAPQPVAPPPPQATGLPRALPSGMLPTTPSVLQSTRAQATPSAPKTSSAPQDLGTVAAVRTPSDATSGSQSLGLLAQSGMLASAPSVPGVLGPSQPKPAPPAKTQANTGNGTPPPQAGTDALSRYLRDHNVRFTGTVLGPVSVGVFRSSLYKMPVVVSLGQDLPDTKITLTDLRGHEAVFTLNDSTQSLSLDLRR